MELLTEFWHLPMIMNLIIPVALVGLLVGFLMWESRLPIERRFLRKSRREKKHKVIHHKVG